jgi:hypothetical protein
MIRPEEQLQIDIVTYLRIVAPQCITFAIRNEGRRGIFGHKLALSMGLMPGLHDLCVLAPHRGLSIWEPYFLEVKTAKGVLNANQKAAHALFRKLGISYAVVRSIDDVKKTLDFWKIITIDN